MSFPLRSVARTGRILRDAGNAGKSDEPSSYNSLLDAYNSLSDTCTVLDTTQAQTETVFNERKEVGHDSSPLLMILFVLVGIPVIFAAIMVIYYRFFSRKGKEDNSATK